MSIHRLSTVLLFVVACSDASLPSPDAVTTTSIAPEGRYTLRSDYSLDAVPVPADRALAALAAATDGPDDPSRYLVDVVISRLPEGQVREIASALAPYLAAYLNDRIAQIAPHLIDGVRELGAGLQRIARRFGTREDVTIVDDRLMRTIVGFELDGTEVLFESAAIADVMAVAPVASHGEILSIGDHQLTLDYGAMLHQGFDRAVIPSVVSGAVDLADALTDLVDCGHLGALIADWLGLGAPSLYSEACTIGLAAAAARLYAALPSGGVTLDMAGTARITSEALEAGTWRGPFGTGAFTGTREATW